jgi:citrate synthase
VSEEKKGPATAIATSSTDQIVVRGRDLVGELMGNVDFTTMICIHLNGGRLPEAGEVAVVNAVLVALMEHGLTPSSITARLIYDSSPESIQGAVAAGLLGAGSQFLGSTEDAAKILQAGVAEVERGRGVDEVAAELAEGFARERTAVPGFGHHIHRPDDPRAPRLFEIARENGTAGAHQELLLALSRALDEAKGKHITINATGAVAAVLSDVGYPWHALRGFSLIARSAGLIGHVMEEAERPTARALWAMAEREVPYDGEMP